jgi:OOP family OmpA-OmpF porin
MKTILAATIAAAALAGSAHAQESGPYFGLGIGQSRIGIDASRIDANALGAGFATSATVTDGRDGAWKIFGGYQYNRHLAVEVAYSDFGRFSTQTVTTGPAGTVGSDTRANAWSMDAIGLLPLSDRIALFGKVGLHRWEVDGRAAAIVGGAASTVGARATGTDWKYGFGARFDVSKSTALRVEWERFRNVGDAATTGRGDIDVLTLGVHYRF